MEIIIPPCFSHVQNAASVRAGIGTNTNGLRNEKAREVIAAMASLEGAGQPPTHVVREMASLAKHI
jgi:hypothetical protein